MNTEASWPIFPHISDGYKRCCVFDPNHSSTYIIFLLIELSLANNYSNFLYSKAKLRLHINYILIPLRFISPSKLRLLNFLFLNHILALQCPTKVSIALVTTVESLVLSPLTPSKLTMGTNGMVFSSFFTLFWGQFTSLLRIMRRCLKSGEIPRVPVRCWKLL